MPATQPDSAPTLVWPGKVAPTPAAPARLRLTETFETLEPAGRASLPTPEEQRGWNRLCHGDNLPILHALAQAGERFRLIYADPPYGSGTLWTRKVRLRGPQRELGRRVLARQPEYGDGLDETGYLQFMYERLVALRALLDAGGTLWLHCDHRHSHHLRAIGDEVFGAAGWLNSITWRSQTPRGAKSSALYFPHSAHTLHIWTHADHAPLTWNSPRRRLILTTAEAEAEFMRDERGFFRTSDPGSYTFESLKRLHAEGRLYAPYGGVVLLDEERRRVYCSHGGNLGVKYYLTDLGKGRHLVERTVDNIWDDIPGLGTTPGEDTGYPTQKSTALLERILATATNPGDAVLDPFCGSGTTPATAQRSGRRWVAIDAGAGAIRVTRGRLQDAINEQAEAARVGGAEAALAPEAARFALLQSEDAAPRRPPVTPGSPAPSAELLITRNAFDPSRIQVAVTAFHSPALETLLEGVAVDWRTCVECICIDPAWDGNILRATVADAPARRTRIVSGSYELELPAQTNRGGGTLPVAMRLTDILGGETVVTFNPAGP